MISVPLMTVVVLSIWSTRPCGSRDRSRCPGRALAALVANDARTRRLCLLAGERHIVVPAASARAFSRALRKLGYPLPALELRDAA